MTVTPMAERLAPWNCAPLTAPAFEVYIRRAISTAFRKSRRLTRNDVLR